MNIFFKIIVAITLLSWPDILISSPEVSRCDELKTASEQQVGLQIFKAESLSVLGGVASVPVIVPIGVVEAVANIPPLLVAQMVACAPALIIDVGLKSQGDMTRFCFAVVPAFMPSARFPLTKRVYSETRRWRRTDIKQVVDKKTSTSDCYQNAGGAENLAVAYTTLENMILDDRYYKRLTPVQLDEIDGKLRALKVRMKAEPKTPKPLQDI